MPSRQKIVVFSRFHNDSRNVFVNTNEGNWFLIFLITLPKHVHMSSRDIRIEYFFHFKAYFYMHTSCLSNFKANTKTWLTSVQFAKVIRKIWLHFRFSIYDSVFNAHLFFPLIMYFSFNCRRLINQIYILEAVLISKPSKSY